jgi:hypothetical protein
MRWLLAVSALVFVAPGAAFAGASVTMGAPGFYGRIEIGGFPHPEVIFPQPVVAIPVPVGVVHEPVYLHVPPGHEKHWADHCHAYDACGRPVFFVRDTWYDTVYVPEYGKMHGHGGGSGKGQGHAQNHGAEHGHGGPKGHGHGKK